ncbi:MAG: hypothetical protein GF381_01390 [Candidatus Pacebacteria bacterium]|nr:hypothetical protein [Candidatus Paceibacterota bacterium]
MKTNQPTHRSNMTRISPALQKIFLVLTVVACLALLGLKKISFAGSLVDVTATLSTSRLSYIGTLNGSASGLFEITVEAAGTYDTDDDDTDQWVVGDTLTAVDATDSSVETATVEQVVDGDSLKIDSPLTDAYEDGDAVYLVTRVNVTVGFTTSSQIAGAAAQDTSAGHFRILIPAASSNNANDYPDAGYFDFGSSTPATVACPADDTGHDFPTAGTATADNYTDSSGNHWHTFTCGYDGVGSDEISFDDLIISNLVMPAPIQSGDYEHDTGTADTYSIIVQHMNATTVVDETTVKVGAIEAVQISAEVVPSLTFTVAGITNTDVVSGGTHDGACGLDNSSNTILTTTANTIPFGEVGTGTFYHGIQKLTITTNAADGASVTAKANDQPGLNGGSCSGDTYNSNYNCIWDANVTSMTHTTEQDWGTSVTSTNHGYGYTLHDGGGTTTEAFSYSNGGIWMARHFADGAEEQSAVELFNSGSAPTNDDNVYICVRLIPDALTSAGYYYNYLTYVATAQF